MLSHAHIPLPPCSYATKPYLNDTRQALSYTYPSGKTITSFTAEELAAMVLTYARDITKDFGGLAVRDCVLTVPSFATMHERRALITSAEIAGLKVLSLIEDNTAAALHYGKDNVFENTTVWV
jgi:hypoxia up-regulated 1